MEDDHAKQIRNWNRDENKGIDGRKGSGSRKLFEDTAKDLHIIEANGES